MAAFPTVQAVKWKYESGDLMELQVSLINPMMADQTRKTVVLKNCRICKSYDGRFYVIGLQEHSDPTIQPLWTILFWTTRLSQQSQNTCSDTSYVLTEADVLNKQNYC